MFSYWHCYGSESRRIGLRIAVLARGEAEGQYSHPKDNMTSRAPVTEPMCTHPFHDIFINQPFFSQLIKMIYQIGREGNKLVISKIQFNRFFFFFFLFVFFFFLMSRPGKNWN